MVARLRRWAIHRKNGYCSNSLIIGIRYDNKTVRFVPVVIPTWIRNIGPVPFAGFDLYGVIKRHLTYVLMWGYITLPTIVTMLPLTKS